MSGSLRNNNVLRIAGLSFALLLASSNLAQRITSFNLYPTSSSVVIKFTISAGPSCSGYSILHGTDSLNYQEIGSDPAICGTTSAPEDKSFTHASPVFNSRNYYKVRLEPYVEISLSKSVFVADASAGGILVYPNPFYAGYELTLRVFNAGNARLTGFMYDPYGKPVKALDLFTTGEIAVTPIPELENGVYMIRLTDGSRTYTDKLIILR